MSNYSGPSHKAKVTILMASKEEWQKHFPKAEEYWLNRYVGQSCDAIIYPDLKSAQLNTEQLKPALPRWQTAPLAFLQES